jgi:hypothetical protein
MTYRGVITTFSSLCAASLCALLVPAPAAALPHKGLPALTPVHHDGLTRALARGRLTPATYALERARSLFQLDRVREEFGNVERPSPRAATPILRDLAVRVRDLAPADRAAALGLLARPTDRSDPGEHHYGVNAILARLCDAARPICVHWDERAADRDAPPGADGDPATVPPDVQATLDIFAGVYDLEVGAYGFLAPKSDATSTNNGGNGKTDIYLADLGGDRAPFFGYCTTDDPHAFDAGYHYYDVSAYCVVDDDFANFGSSETPQGFREVTAAHEYLHAVQFRYDWFEDLWLMEGTAMFMEDQYADDVDDNVNYLLHSAIVSPWVPVDRGAEGFEYGAWLWWRFLTEEAGQLTNPQMIREVWESVAGAHIDTDGPGPDTIANDLYSLRGLRKVVQAHGLVFADLFGKFAWANRLPSTFYEEGLSYPHATVSRLYTLGRRGTETGRRATHLRHLASRYMSFKPGAVTPADAMLRVNVNLPDPSHAPKAFLLVKETGQPWLVHGIALNSNGNGARTVRFGHGTITDVELVLTNASPKMRCGRDTEYSCTGVGVDDLRRYAFRARVG